MAAPRLCQPPGIGVGKRGASPGQSAACSGNGPRERGAESRGRRPGRSPACPSSSASWQACPSAGPESQAQHSGYLRLSAPLGPHQDSPLQIAPRGARSKEKVWVRARVIARNAGVAAATRGCFCGCRHLATSGLSCSSGGLVKRAFLQAQPPPSLPTHSRAPVHLRTLPEALLQSTAGLAPLRPCALFTHFPLMVKQLPWFSLCGLRWLLYSGSLPSRLGSMLSPGLCLLTMFPKGTRTNAPTALL